MDVTWSYITDSLQSAKSLKIFNDFVVQEQRQGLEVREDKEKDKDKDLRSKDKDKNL